MLTGLGYSDRQATLMSFPEDAIQLFSVVVAGFAAQAIPNSRCALMILANTIVLIGAVLVDSQSLLAGRAPYANSRSTSRKSRAESTWVILQLVFENGIPRNSNTS